MFYYYKILGVLDNIRYFIVIKFFEGVWWLVGVNKDI